MLGSGTGETVKSIRQDERVGKGWAAGTMRARCNHREGNKIRLRWLGKAFLLFLMTMIYKIVLEYGFYKILTEITTFYSFHLDTFRYVNGTIWCIVLFWNIKFKKCTASSFFVYFVYAFQIVPITIVYALNDSCNSILYYNSLCMGYLLFELLVFGPTWKNNVKKNQQISKMVIPFFGICFMLVLVAIYRSNGMPSMMALNIFNVYVLRSSGSYAIGKYWGYMVNITATLIFPVIAAKTIRDRNRLMMLLCIVFQVIIYLYTGHKLYLFAIMLVVITSFWLKRKNFYWECNCSICMGFTMLTLLMLLVKDPNGLAWKLYSLFIRRTLIVPAELKFVHYDYFSNHPYLGFYGVLPKVLVPFKPEYYMGISYTHEIGRLYYDSPLMSADTGTLAEGFSRFGYFGIILEFMILAIIFKQIEKLSKNCGFATAVSFFVFSIYALSETQLVSSMVGGSWMFALIVLWFYNEKTVQRDASIKLKTNGF